MIEAGVLASLEDAFQNKEARTLSVAGYTVQCEPDAPVSGMTLFGGYGFVVGRDAFESKEELTKTLLHETQRLNSSIAAQQGFSAEIVTQETEDAFNFSEKAYRIAFKSKGMD